MSLRYVVLFLPFLAFGSLSSAAADTVYLHVQLQVLNEPETIVPNPRQVGIPEGQETVTFDAVVLRIIDGQGIKNGTLLTVEIEYYSQPESDQVRATLGQLHKGTVLEVRGSTVNGILVVSLGNTPNPEQWIKVISTSTGNAPLPIPEFREDIGQISLLVLVITVVLMARPGIGYIRRFQGLIENQSRNVTP
jgi:hypothetical protein